MTPPPRAGLTLVGGALYETNQVALPAFVRRSKLYDSTIARMLRLTVELVGGVDGVYRDLTRRRRRCRSESD